MDKKSIQENNSTKHKKNNINDKNLRFLDKKQYSNQKKIEKISQDIFILKREINDIARVIKINRDYPGIYYKKVDHLANKFSIVSKQIKLIILKLMLNLHKKQNRRLSKKINAQVQ
ncbi:MAG: hypothetical protein REH83_05155 [Rickettsiella sp.]|nr:hypothetical protein [Rickettsiella sp.]